MSDRESPAVPATIAVEFRSASSFLIAYTMHLSRGGLFLATAHELPVGTALELALEVPGAATVGVSGQVAWRRAEAGPDGPAGVGVEVAEVSAAVGQLIDRLVSDFHGISVLIMAGDSKDRASIGRLLRSVVASANLIHAADAQLADTLLTDDIDVAVIDLEGDPEGGQAAIRRARALPRAVPVIALASSPWLRDVARGAGADELISTPPALEELQLAVVRALGRPFRVR